MVKTWRMEDMKIATTIYGLRRWGIKTLELFKNETKILFFPYMKDINEVVNEERKNVVKNPFHIIYIWIHIA